MCTSHTLGFYHDVINDVIVFQNLKRPHRFVAGAANSNSFPVAEGVLSPEIHHRLLAVFKDD